MIELTDFTTNDISELMTWIKSEDELVLWAGSRFKWPFDRRQMEDYMTRRLANNLQYTIFKAVDPKTKATIGHIELATIDFTNLSATVVHVLIKPDLRNKGYGREMVKKVLEYGFNFLNLHRIDLVVFDFNRQAIACYQKLGFKEEGLMRDTKRVGNSYWSMYLMSMLDHEWRVILNAR